MTTTVQDHGLTDEQFDALAERIEQRGAKKLLLIMLTNVVALIAIIGAAFSALGTMGDRMTKQESHAQLTDARIDINTHRIDMLQESDQIQQATSERKLDSILSRVDALTKLLLEHNAKR